MCDKREHCLTCNKMLDVCLFQGERNCMVCRNLYGLWLESAQRPDTNYHNGRLKRNYGISLSVYWRIYREQGGKCGICKTAFPHNSGQKSLPLVVDHNHETGKVRGLLCDNCNRGLGCFKDDLDNFKNARTYLRKS